MSLNQGGHAMRTFDLAPLYRSTVGFDRLFSMLDQVAGVDGAPSYPPYNIERTGENAYRITLAVAGFTEADLSIEKKEDTLTIRGEKQVKDETAGEVLYQGIAARAFERAFQLEDHVEVKGASLENGLLHVDLVREVPEAMKPRQIPIKGEKQAKTDEKKGEVLYQGIAARTFERVFQLADFVEVKGASIENGLLHVDLVREIPEAKKPRTIPISSGVNTARVIEGSKAA
jgi:molecular chaperone IbpA